MINLTEDALEFIATHGKSATLVLTKNASGCCSMNFGPDVRLGKPEPGEENQYHCRQYGDVTLYVPKSLLISRPFDIVARRFLWHRYMAVEGWKVV